MHEDALSDIARYKGLLKLPVYELEIEDLCSTQDQKAHLKL